MWEGSGASGCNAGGKKGGHSPQRALYSPWRDTGRDASTIKEIRVAESGGGVYTKTYC